MSLFKKKSKNPINLSPSGYPIIKYDEHFNGIQIVNGYYIYNTYNYKDVIFQNCIVFGGQGSSKTRACIIPNLLNPKLKDMSFLVFDPSGELFSMTSDFQKKIGKEVYFLSLYRKADRLNMLDVIGDKASSIISYCQTLLTNATKSIEGANRISETASSWFSMSSPLLASSICVLKLFYKENPSLGKATVSEAITLLQSSSEEEFYNIVKKYKSAFDIYPFKKKLQRQTVTYQNCITNISTYLSNLNTEEIKYIMNDTTIPINDFRKKPTVIYLQGHKNNSKYTASVLSPIVEYLFQSVSDDLLINDKNNKLTDVYFFLDEFATLGKIDGLDGIFRNFRKYRVGIFIVVQTLSQLNAVFNSYQVSAILGNISHKLFLRNNADIDTAQYLTTIAGKTEITEKDYSYNSFGESINYRIKTTTKDEIPYTNALNISPNSGYLHVGSLGSIKINNIKKFDESIRFKYNYSCLNINDLFEPLDANFNIFSSNNETSLVLDNYRMSKTSSKNINLPKIVSVSNEVAITNSTISRCNTAEKNIKLKVDSFIRDNF